MSDIIEQIILCLLGAIAGAVVGVIGLDIFHHYYQNLSEGYRGFIFVSMLSVLGILSAIIVVLSNRIRVFHKGVKVRDEAVTLITHEMRTALTSTGWSIETIISDYQKELKKEDQDMLKGVIASIHSTVMHSVNLLDISLLDAGKLTVSLEWKNLADVQKIVEEILEKYKLGAEKKKLQFIADVHLDGNKKIEIDMMRLRIIVENLLENAIQYTQDQGEIKFYLANTEQEMNIVVSDTGIGIPESEKSKIFKEFYRASNARKKLSSGSGIGLYMCQKYIKAHHGTISFKSVENKGTTFYVAIPLKTEANVNEFLRQI